MSGVDRAALIAGAKAAALEVAVRTRAGEPAEVLAGASWHELYALVLVLASASDLRVLTAVCARPDVEDAAEEARRLLAARAEAARLERAGLPKPLLLRVAEGEYRARLRAAREQAA